MAKRDRVTDADAVKWTVAEARLREAEARLETISIQRAVLDGQEKDAQAARERAARDMAAVRSRNGLPADAIVIGPGDELPIGTVLRPSDSAWDLAGDDDAAPGATTKCAAN